MRFKGRKKTSTAEGTESTGATVTTATEAGRPAAKAAAEDGQQRRDVPAEMMRVISEEVLNKIDASVVSEIPRLRLIEEVERLVAESADRNRYLLNKEEQEEIATNIVDDMTGQGPIDALLEDETVTEIMVNGPWNIWIERNGKTMRSDIRFRDEQHLLTIAKRMARFVGRRLDEQSPYVDARLPDGSRVNIVTPPIALDGTSISIRKFPKQRLRLVDLQRFGALSAQMSTFIECIASSRCNVLVSGGTSSGKTTILNALSDFIRPTERVITIEDSAELKIDIGNLVRLETRAATSEAGSKAITQRDLVANSLRMRPDRIILGEVRREEAFDLLQAMSTGHDGSMGTLHSNNPRDTCQRLESMVLMGGMKIDSREIRRQIVSAVDFIIHAARGADGKRRVTNITEITGLEGDTISLQDVFFYEFPDDKTMKGGDFVANRVNLRTAEKLKEYGMYEKAIEAIQSSPPPRHGG